MGYQPTPANLIGERAKLSASDVAIQLLDLELLGRLHPFREAMSESNSEFLKPV
nr:hypothetical protein [Budvicia aquatica]